MAVVKRFFLLQDDLAAGKEVRLTLENVRRTLDDLTARRQSGEQARLASRHLVSATPVIFGGALVIPAGLLRQRQAPDPWSADPQARARIEQVAMGAVLAAETALGHAVSNVSAHNGGRDVTSQPPAQDGRLLPPPRVTSRSSAAPRARTTAPSPATRSSPASTRATSSTAPSSWWMVIATRDPSTSASPSPRSRTGR